LEEIKDIQQVPNNTINDYSTVKISKKELMISIGRQIFSFSKVKHNTNENLIFCNGALYSFDYILFSIDYDLPFGEKWKYKEMLAFLRIYFDKKNLLSRLAELSANEKTKELFIQAKTKFLFNQMEHAARTSPFKATMLSPDAFANVNSMKD